MMKLRLIILCVLGLSLAACNPNYEDTSIQPSQDEERASVFKPDFRKWMLPDEDLIVTEDPAQPPEEKPTENKPAVAKPTEAKPSEVKPQTPAANTGAKPTQAGTTKPAGKKLSLAGRLPISYPKDFKAAGDIKPTVYYIPMVNETKPACKTEELVPMLSASGEELLKVCPKTHDGCALQGSCFVKTKEESAILNFISYSKGKYHFFEVDMEHCPFGQGVRSGCLDPFYTVAADLSIFKAGDVIYVPKVAGTLLPNGETHHGYFIVRDMGGVIDGDGRFDFFSGFSSWRDTTNPFNKLKLTDINTKTPYYRVSGETADIVRKVRNFPGLPGFKAP